MLLNFDCFRDVLLCIAKIQIPSVDTHAIPVINPSDLYNHEDLDNYSETDIFTSLYYLIEADYIKATINQLKQSTHIGAITGITILGQNFLYATKEPSAWEKTKNVASKAGIGLLKYMGELTKAVATASATALITSSINNSNQTLYTTE